MKQPAKKTKRQSMGPITITGCNFMGVRWDASTAKTFEMVAEGLLNMTQLFKKQDVNVNAPMLSFNAGQKEAKP